LDKRKRRIKSTIKKRIKKRIKSKSRSKSRNEEKPAFEHLSNECMRSDSCS